MWYETKKLVIPLRIFFTLTIFVHALWVSTLEISQPSLGIHPKPKTSFCDYLLNHNPNCEYGWFWYEFTINISTYFIFWLMLLNPGGIKFTLACRFWSLLFTQESNVKKETFGISSSNTLWEDHEACHESRHEVNTTPNNTRTEALSRKVLGTWRFTNEINSAREIFSHPKKHDLSVHIRRLKWPLMAKIWLSKL
jgi:hypothetical protein